MTRLGGTSLAERRPWMPLAWLLGAQGLLAVVVVPVLLNQAPRLREIQGLVLWPGDLPPTPWILKVADVAWPLLFAASAFLWLWLQYRAQAMLSAIGVRNARFDPAWAVMWWFVPVANLVYPALAVGELLHGAKVGPGRSAGRLPARVLVRVLLWWLPLLAGLVAGGIGMQMRAMYTTGSTYLVAPDVPSAANRLLIIASIAFACAAPFAIAIVLRVGRLLAAWGAGAIEVPGRPDAP